MSKQTNSGGPRGRLILVCGAIVLLGALLIGATFALRGQMPSEDVTRAASMIPASTSDGQRGAATGLWAHLLQGEPAAYSALFSFIAIIATAIIAFRTYALSKAIRAGQVAQEQIKMVLEIDSELIKDPSLWIVHGERYRPLPESEGSLEKILEEIKQKGGHDDVIEVIRICVSQSPPASRKSDEGYTLRQLKQLALVTRYFNMFDFVHASLVERYVGAPEQFGFYGDRKKRGMGCVGELYAGLLSREQDCENGMGRIYCSRYLCRVVQGVCGGPSKMRGPKSNLLHGFLRNIM